jgi:hypothetical protein
VLLPVGPPALKGLISFAEVELRAYFSCQPEIDLVLLPPIAGDEASCLTPLSPPLLTPPPRPPRWQRFSPAEVVWFLAGTSYDIITHAAIARLLAATMLQALHPLAQ